jgi:hypothetical protein
MIVKFLATSGDAYFFISDTFLDGQQRDVWCNSKTPITDMKMHKNGISPNQPTDSTRQSVSCFMVYYNGVISRLYIYGDVCSLTDINWFEISFLCE